MIIGCNFISFEAFINSAVNLLTSEMSPVKPK